MIRTVALKGMRPIVITAIAFGMTATVGCIASTLTTIRVGQKPLLVPDMITAEVWALIL